MNSGFNQQSGNVLFYILVAVVLLAALSYAVAMSNRGNLNAVNEEKARLLATEMIEYANVMANATAQVKLRGIKETELCFDDPNWGNTDYANPSCSDNATRIFGLQGGGVTWARPPEAAMDQAATPDNLWHIYGDNEIFQMGTTCAADSCVDLILVADELRENVCIQINDLLKVNNPSDTPPTDTLMGTTKFIGTFSYSETVGDENTQSLRAKTGGCFENTTNGKFTFYKVLVSR